MPAPLFSAAMFAAAFGGYLLLAGSLTATKAGAAAFVLMATGLLLKAAQVPFHFWLRDAQSVAPSPVPVVFSGIMVTIGVFGLLRLVFTVLPGSDAVATAVHTLLGGPGVASVLVDRPLPLLLACAALPVVAALLASHRTDAPALQAAAQLGGPGRVGHEAGRRRARLPAQRGGGRLRGLAGRGARAVHRRLRAGLNPTG